MSNALVEQVRAIEAPMVEPSGSYFSGSELDDYRCLIRLTVEFFHYLQGDLTR
jgi:hypothetical protein